MNAEENPKRGTVTERVFREKSKAQKHIEMMQRCGPDFLRKTRSATIPKMAYILVQHGIFSLILAYAI